MKLVHQKLTLVLILLLSTMSVFAQVKNKINVGVSPFEWNPRTADGTYVSMVYDHISFLLANNSAVKLVDRGSWDDIQEERDLLKTEPFILTETIEQGRSLGAEKLVTGKIYLTDIQPEGTGYSVAFSIYLAVVDVESGVVEDNIMVSPRGAEDSDKMIEVLRTVRKAQILPRGRFITKMIDVMELFDVIAKYRIAGVSQDDSFKEALNQLDKTLVPFFEYHFGGNTSGYTPDNKKKAQVVDSYSNNNKIKIDAEERFQAVERLTGNRLRVFGGRDEGIKRNTKLGLMTEIKRVKVTLNGDTIEAMEQRLWGEMSFERYEGDFSIFALDKKNEKDIPTILNERDKKATLYLENQNPLTNQAIEEEKKFQISSIESDKLVEIVAKEEDGIKKSTKFSLVRETIKRFKDFNGEEGSGILREELGVFKFAEGRGELQLIELEKPDDITAAELIGKPKKGEKVFVLFKLKDY